MTPLILRIKITVLSIESRELQFLNVQSGEKIDAQCVFFYSRNLVKLKALAICKHLSKLKKGDPKRIPLLKVVNDGLGEEIFGSAVTLYTVIADLA